MKTFNINDYIYIQITYLGFEHLKKTFGDDYIKHCITTNKKIINSETWYKLQAHNVFSHFPVGNGFDVLYSPKIMFDDFELKEFITK